MCHQIITIGLNTICVTWDACRRNLACHAYIPGIHLAPLLKVQPLTLQRYTPFAVLRTNAELDL